MNATGFVVNLRDYINEVNGIINQKLSENYNLVDNDIWYPKSGKVNATILIKADNLIHLTDGSHIAWKISITLDQGVDKLTENYMSVMNSIFNALGHQPVTDKRDNDVSLIDGKYYFGVTDDWEMYCTSWIIPGIHEGKTGAFILPISE